MWQQPSRKDEKFWTEKTKCICIGTYFNDSFSNSTSKSFSCSVDVLSMEKNSYTNLHCTTKLTVNIQFQYTTFTLLLHHVQCFHFHFQVLLQHQSFEQNEIICSPNILHALVSKIIRWIDRDLREGEYGILYTTFLIWRQKLQNLFLLHLDTSNWAIFLFFFEHAWENWVSVSSSCFIYSNSRPSTCWNTWNENINLLKTSICYCCIRSSSTEFSVILLM